MSEKETPGGGTTLTGASGFGKARLVVQQGPGAGRKLRLDLDVAVVGRHTDAHLQLEDAGVSRRHAEFRYTEHGLELKDLHSQNGTFVNGVRVAHTLVHAGDKIRFGPNVVVE